MVIARMMARGAVLSSIAMNRLANRHPVLADNLARIEPPGARLLKVGRATVQEAVSTFKDVLKAALQPQDT